MSFAMATQDITANATQEPSSTSTAQSMQHGSVPAFTESAPAQQLARNAAGSGLPPSPEKTALLMSQWAEGAQRSAGAEGVQHSAEKPAGMLPTSPAEAHPMSYWAEGAQRQGGAARVHKAAQPGPRDAGAPLPYLETSQSSLGCHDVSGPAARASESAARGGGSPLPVELRAQLEAAGGVDLSDVAVYYDSPRPAEIGAAAFALDPEIHLGPGYADELGHEAAHIVQQRQGLVAAGFDAGGTLVNADPSLEAAADRMAQTAASATRENAPKQIAPARRSHASVLQARWLLFLTHPRQTSFIFWEEDDKEQGDPPSEFSEFARGKPLEKGSYAVAGGADRLKRNMPFVYSLQFYRQVNGSQTGYAQRDNYNSFGRFSSQLTISTFLPCKSLNPEQREKLMKDLEAKDSTFRPVESLSDKLDLSGYPRTVKVQGGEVLQLLNVSQLGATYGNHQAGNKRARLDRTQEGDVSELSVAGSEMIISDQPEGVDSENYVERQVKRAKHDHIDKETVESWSGKKRSLQQKSVMGVSASEVAENAGYDPKEGKGWEWLHLICHSVGGIETEGPQVPGNLVVGTHECNTQMIIVEEFLKDIVTRYNLKAKLCVMANMSDPERQIANLISYDFVVLSPEDGKPLEVFHWSFDPLSRVQPTVQENRQNRYAGQMLFGNGKSRTI